jgi:hypothetical protein
MGLLVTSNSFNVRKEVAGRGCGEKGGGGKGGEEE